MVRVAFLSIKLLFSLLYMPILIQCSTEGCEKLPSVKGNFSFIAKTWQFSFRTVKLYENVQINCTTNMPNATVELQYNNVGQWNDVFNDKDLFQGTTKAGQTFILKEVLNRHNIQYRCFAKHVNEEICLFKGILFTTNSQTEIEIQIIPKTRPITATEGDDLQFYCEAEGLGSKLTSYLKWYKQTDDKGSKVELDKSLTKRQGYSTGGNLFDKELVYIKNVSKIDAGTYICERHQEIASTRQSKSVKIVISDPTKPNVKLVPSSREVRIPEKASKLQIVCSYVSGLPRPRMQWRDPRNKIEHSCDKYTVNCTLDIYSASYPKHNGRFVCEAINRAGTFRIDVNIVVLVPVQLKLLNNQQVAGFDDKAELVCKISKANPLPNFRWFYQLWSCVKQTCVPDETKWKPVVNKDSIIPSEGTATNRSKLIVPASKITAFYSCRADNTIGRTSLNFTLHRVANVPTTFKLSNAKTYINMNESFHINCTAATYVYEDIGWIKDGKPFIADQNRIILKSFITVDYLQINSISFTRLILDDSGNYTCVGSKRRGGTERRSSVLVVKALTPPVIRNFTDLVVNQKEDNLMLECDVIGNPQPIVSWKFNHRSLPGLSLISSADDCSTRAPGYYLVEKFVQRNKIIICHMNYKKNQGKYKCIARNKVAIVAKDIKLEIHAKPKIINWASTSTILAKSTIPLYCESEGNPPANITLYRLENGKKKTLPSIKTSGNGSAYTHVNFDKSMSGKYMCFASNRYGNDSKSISLTAASTSPQKATLPSGIISAIVVSCVVCILIVIVIACWYKKRLEEKFAPYLAPNRSFELDPDRSLFEQSGELPYDPDWEFPRERLNFLKMIGSGAFGEVWLAEAQGILVLDARDKTSNASKRRSKMRRSQRYTLMHGKDKKKNLAQSDTSFEKTIVAVKTLKGDASDSEYKDLASELKILIHIGENKQIVNLLGACTRSGKLCVILEYCPHGSLLSFLRERRDIFEPVWQKNETDMGSELTLIDLTTIAYQVAKAMDFLASKKCIHRDLAARNVLVGVDYIVKIADFGLARDIYKDELYMKSTSGLLPVKWMAPESLFDKIYTSQSDVWSFGIVLWEIFTLGGSPYPGLPTEDLFSFLEQGRRMEQPELCPLELYAIMRDCWERNPIDRPLFSQIVDRTGQILFNRAGNENSYLRFEKEDGPIGATESDYLLPVNNASFKQDEYIRAASGHPAERKPSEKNTFDLMAQSNAPSYQNDDEIRLSLLGTHDDTDYANAQRYSDDNEAVV